MSWTHCAWASKQTTGSAINKLVLMMMADATSHDNPLLILRIKTLAEKCEASESSVKRSVKDLEELGLLICVERFFENTQQSNAYILVTDSINPLDAEKIAKENERSGCFFKIREGGRFSVNPGVGSEGTQGGFTVTSRATPSSSLPSSSIPIGDEELRAGATKQQPESTLPISDIAPAPRPRKQPRSAKPTIPNVADFLAWAAETHPEWVREAEAWYKRMESQDWVKVNGERVMNAKGTFNTWLANGWIKRIVGSSTGWAKL